MFLLFQMYKIGCLMIFQNMTQQQAALWNAEYLESAFLS